MKGRGEKQGRGDNWKSRGKAAARGRGRGGRINQRGNKKGDKRFNEISNSQENKEVDFVENYFKKIEHPTILTRKYVHNQATLLVGKAIQMRTSSALLIAIKFLITTLMMPNELNFSIQQTSNHPPQTKEKDLYGVPSDQPEGNNDMFWGENGLAYLWIGPQLSVLLASPSTSKTNKQVPAFSTLQQKILSLYGQKHEGYV